MTLQSSASSRTETSLLTGGGAAGCLVQSQQLGAQHAQNSGDDRRLQEENPLPLPPLTIMNSTVTTVKSFRRQHHLSGPEVGQSHWLYCEKGPAEAVFPPPAKEVQPATGAAETVLLGHHWDCPVFICNCLVWFSYQNRHLKTTTDSQDCWKDYHCPSAQPPRTVHLQSEEKG